jgi:choice-of-anchor A domain-containing protein
MKSLSKIILTSAIFTTSFAGNALFADLNSNPWDLNVYVIDNIGTSANPYESDIEGMAGAGGNVYLQNFSLNVNGSVTPTTPYSLYSGGTVNTTSGQFNNGGVQAVGSVTLTNTTTSGNVSSGGSLFGSSGQITGNATLKGTNQSTITINGSVSTGQTFSPVLNQTTVANFFKNASNVWNNLSPTTTWTNSSSTLILNNPMAGLNVVDISLSQWNALTGIQNNLPSNAYIVFNIDDTTTPGSDTLNAISLNGISANNILLNLPNASVLAMTGGTYGSVLATNATITFTNGVLQGNLVAENLQGSGQVDSGAFVGYSTLAAPEPSTYLLLCGMIGVFWFVKGRKAVNVSA